jgi:hypothetical protein
MQKEDNQWEIHIKFNEHMVDINSNKYYVRAETACLAHAILLLVDAVNDKKI